MQSNLQKTLMAVVLLFAGARFVSAQALPAGVGPGTTVTIGGGYSVYHLDYGQRSLGGAQLWADGNLFWRTGLELEARRLRQNQDLNTHADTYLLGPRFVFSPRRVQPYVKVLAGVGHFSYPYGYARGKYLVVAAGGGVDLRLNNRFQVRVIDVQYQDWPQFTFGAMHTYGISSGLSITLYRGPTRLGN